MSWVGTPGRRADAAPAEDEIDEELMFHLRSLVDDNLAAGMPPDEAWRDARNRFGSLRHYSDACRRPTLAARLPWLGAAAAALTAAGVALGWMIVEVRALRRENAAAVQAKEVAVAEAAAARRPSANAADAPRTDLAGRILDAAGGPIGDADVFVILKTWPNGRYRQEAFVTTTGGDGAFRLPTLVPAGGQIAVLVAALKDGYALTSSYQLREEGDRIETDDLTLRLDEAPRVTLLVRDGQGRPVPNARVLPLSRQSPDGESHTIYFQGSEPLQVACDAEGRTDLACFKRGDEAEIYVRPPGGDWQSRQVRIPDDGAVILTADEAVGGG